MFAAVFSKSLDPVQAVCLIRCFFLHWGCVRFPGVFCVKAGGFPCQSDGPSSLLCFLFVTKHVQPWVCWQRPTETRWKCLLHFPCLSWILKGTAAQMLWWITADQTIRKSWRGHTEGNDGALRYQRWLQKPGEITKSFNLIWNLAPVETRWATLKLPTFYIVCYGVTFFSAQLKSYNMSNAPSGSWLAGATYM